jgi:pimeloyl-ACP methyl ester carboxylesterase
VADALHVQYAQSGDVDIACDVLGEGPPDMVLVGGFITHLTVLWEDPDYRAFCERLASFGRLIRFDKRGMGLSDRVRVGTLDERMDDVRASASPRAAEAFMRMAFDIDVRGVVPSIAVPTLIVHATHDLICHVENARWPARNIDGARYVELDGFDHAPWGDRSDEIVAEIQEFLTGTRDAPVPDTVLATVLFTDIVGSTEHASRLGDQRWRELLERHNHGIRQELAHYHGRELDTAGDGFLASFDGPGRAIACARAAV